MAARTEFQPESSIRRHLFIAIGLIVILVGGVGGWAASTEISGAVIAEGQLVVDSNVKKVQHPTGGIVGELRVQNGSIVKAGDVVLRLDETQTKANLAIIVKGLTELIARKTREEAERDGTQMAFPPELVRLANGDPEVRLVLEGELRQFEIRRSAREGQKAQLRERISQLNEEIRGLTSQEAGKAKEIYWIRKELDGVRELWDKNLVQFTRVTALERDAARIEGERGNVIATTAQARGKISEIELQIMQIDQDMRSEVSKDLADIRAKTAELTEKKIAVEDQMKRLELRAPQDGVVHQLDVHTVGGVISAGQPVMLIVPNADVLKVEAKLRPQDINQVKLGQLATLRFTSFNQRTTPEINGEVGLISADVSQDPKSGVNYYTVRIDVPPNELDRIVGQKLVPGMPVEVFLQTGLRTVISYIVRPFHDQATKAFREN
ncbi:HlyD family type I secretion periplasmic adaptor subunit [Xanthobacteraceae bacterium Astr-EGSB]|uniref:HlyD family type I secretion periplasmic adaptor subunit n=1 Tax=Astrobacterium formosum TaxID=3069710 RepID=UPI0027B809DD|nr:HlyD family type I secretion periplasmic adaptor subunit [Xanthobacteraceae bacterium Astr-EGSB]